MSARRLLLVGLAYLVFDLADPVLPSAFSFEVRDSEIEEAVHVRRRPEDRPAITVEPAPPERRVEPREDSPTRLHLGVRAEPTGDRKSTRLNSSHLVISYAVFCLK